MNNSDPCPLRVLVVDNSVDMTASMSCLMELWGHEVRVAHDGATALEIARAYCPHVVVLDSSLEKRWDGCDVASQFRALPELDNVCLICMSGYATEADKRRYMQAGFDYFLPKGADPKEVEQLLEAEKTPVPGRMLRAPAHAGNGDRLVLRSASG